MKKTLLTINKTIIINHNHSHYPLVYLNIDPENKQSIVETSPPTPIWQGLLLPSGELT